MLNNRSIPSVVVIPELAYPNVREAAEWLCGAFRFGERLLIANHRAQLSVGKSGAIVVTEAPPVTATDSLHSVMVRVDNVREHHVNAQAHGAVILREPADYPYGERQYTAKDFASHVWTFTETIADVDPAQWGGTLVGQ
jgi:uncharacterized glyoxalase superfamily protein PhnB